MNCYEELVAYLDFFRTFSLNPEECFFIDDMPANVEAARNLGMDGCVYYGDVEELRMNLRNKIDKCREFETKW